MQLDFPKDNPLFREHLTDLIFCKAHLWTNPILHVETENQVSETNVTVGELLSRHESELWSRSATSYQWWLLVSNNRVTDCDCLTAVSKKAVIGRKLGAYRISRRLRAQGWIGQKPWEAEAEAVSGQQMRMCSNHAFIFGPLAQDLES